MVQLAYKYRQSRELEIVMRFAGFIHITIHPLLLFKVPGNLRCAILPCGNTEILLSNNVETYLHGKLAADFDPQLRARDLKGKIGQYIPEHLIPNNTL